MIARRLFFFVFLISIIYSCKKNDNLDTFPNNILGSFSVIVQNRQATSAKIYWNKPANSNNNTIYYKTVLNSLLIAQNLTDTFFTLTNLLPNQTYQGKVIAYTSATDSSISAFTLNPILFTAADSIFILAYVTDAGGLGLKFDYDTVNKRLSSWEKFYSSFNYDSTKIFYNNTGKILSLVGKKTSSTPFNITPNIFLYDAQNRVSKVYHKTLYSTNESYSYMTTVNFPLDWVYEIDSYDSLNYDGLNRIVSVYNFSKYYDQTNALFIVNNTYKLINYLPSNDSLPDKIKTYTKNSSGGFDETILNLSNYNNKVNPYYNLFGKLNLIGVNNFARITTPTFLPYYYFGYQANADLTGIPYLCTNLGLTYTYNSDNLISQCIYGLDNFNWVRFSYLKVKK